MMGLGEFAQVVSGRGGPSAASQIITQAIERDIAQQKNELGKMRAGISTKRNLLSDLKEQFDDEEEAILADRAMLFDRAQKKLQQVANQTDSQKVLANAQRIMGELEAQKQSSLADLDQLAGDKAVVTTLQKFVSPESQGSGDAESWKRASSLRNEYNKLQTTKDTALRKSYLNTLQATAAEDSAAGDLAFIFAYMKMLDPGSTVREGEFANAQNAGGVDTKVINLYNQIRTGERLSPAQRAEFLSTAQVTYDKQLEEQLKVDERYKGLAERSGVNPIDVIIIREPEELGATRLSQTFQASE
jgi:hypothetical protein